MKTALDFPVRAPLSRSVVLLDAKGMLALRASMALSTSLSASTQVGSAGGGGVGAAVEAAGGAGAARASLSIDRRARAFELLLLLLGSSPSLAEWSRVSVSMAWQRLWGERGCSWGPMGS